jgi:hypothetical protein
MPNEDDSHVQFKRKQFPIRLAFALTINKSQGQSLNNVGIYIDSPLFSHGHLYVALSRITNKKNLKIMIKPIIYNNTAGFYINNIVYKEVLKSVINY